MKVAVVGCGALGSFYGAKLCRANEDVHFLLRSDYEVVRRRGVAIGSAQGDFQVRPKCARTPEEIGIADLVLIGLKTTANDEFPRLLPPLVGPGTAILTLQNGLGNEEALAKIFPEQQIIGGLAFVCLNRIEPGVIQHIDHGTIVIGEFNRWPEPRTHDLASMFRNAGVPCKVVENIAQSHWEKLSWNIPFNGLGVASVAGREALLTGELRANASLGRCLTTDQLLADAEWEGIMRELIREVITGARALDFKLSDELEQIQIERTRTMGAYKPSSLIDFERGQAIELQSLFLEPLRQIERAGVSAPRLSNLCRVLEQLDAAAKPSRSAIV